MATGGPGRNDSCPCGSGRKFKHCCLAQQDAADAARLRVRAAEGRVVPAILDYALATWGDPLVAHAWEDFWLYDDVPEDMPAEPEFDAMFPAWFTLGFVPDPECPERTPDWPVEPLGLHWLASLGGEVEAMDRAFVLQACRSPLSVFAVEQVTPGQSVDVKDILTGRRFHTRELTASRSLHLGDIVFTRVVTVDDVSLLFGTAPYAAPPAFHLEVLDWRDHGFRKRKPTRALVAEFDYEVRSLYLAHPRRSARSAPADGHQQRRRPGARGHAHLRARSAGAGCLRATAAAGDPRQRTSSTSACSATARA